MIRWKTWVKRAAYRFAYYSGLEYLISRSLPVNAAVILMYHGVSDRSRLPAEVDFHLTTAAFERQMRMLKRRYRVVPLSQLLDLLERRERLNKEVVITFDDGYRNNLADAHPVLERLGLPYVIYLATAYIGKDEWLPLNELYALWSFGRINDQQMRELRKQMRGSSSAEMAGIVRGLGAALSQAERAQGEDSFGMLDWDQVRHLAARGVEFGSHTHTHCNMAVERPADQRAELEKARDLIAAELGREPETFAYPFGKPQNWSAETRESVIKAGHRCAILATGGLVKPGDDLFAMPRTGYFPETWYFACELMALFLRESIRP